MLLVEHPNFARCRSSVFKGRWQVLFCVDFFRMQLFCSECNSESIIKDKGEFPGILVIVLFTRVVNSSTLQSRKWQLA